MRFLTTAVVFVLAFSVLVLGCARAGGDPINPTNEMSVTGAAASGEGADADVHDPHMLWGQWTLYFNDDHTSVDVVPMRQARLHLNALKFLEEYCAECVQITKIKNNGDGTIDLTVRITHPFNGFPEYTGFDVKGIIMFNGSLMQPISEWNSAPLPKPFFRVSWREMGDPEVLNPDGYAYRWTPNYDSGSDLPIFNYWEGKYATGVPNADLNAYLDFYSQEERHIFRCDASVVHTYKIWLPPGPVIAGYAVEACWEPPLVIPVVNPVTDFPSTANQPEAYHFKFVLNNGEEITDCAECCGFGFDCSTLYAEHSQWGGLISDRTFIWWPEGGGHEGHMYECEPSQPGKYTGYVAFHSCDWADGNIHRFVASNHYSEDGESLYYAFTIFDIIVK